MARSTIEGYVKALRLDKGFGFLSLAHRPDVFFHCSALDETLEFDGRLQERRVSFKIIETGRGARAVDIRPAD